MGEAIVQNSDQMHKSNSTQVADNSGHLQEQGEVLLKRKQTDLFKDIVDANEEKESVTVDSTMDTNVNATRRPAEYKPGDYTKLESESHDTKHLDIKPKFESPAYQNKNEENKATEGPQDDYFEMIQRQFLDKVPVSRG